MIQRVFEQAKKSQASRVCVATDDARIVDAVTAFGGEAVMTSSDHETGTDRIHEAALNLGLLEQDIVVNVQGDEPLIPPEVIDEVADAISPEAEMATLCEVITSSRDIANPNVVKVVMSSESHALYFSRAPMPWDRDAWSGGVPDSEAPVTPGPWHRHLGIYAYTRGMLDRFVRWPVSGLESTEKLEQLRVLENGGRIAISVASCRIPPGIDVPEDLQRTLKELSLLE